MALPRRKLSEIASLNTTPREFDGREFLNDCAAQLAGEQVVLVWHGDPQTGSFEGFDVVEAGKGIVASVWAKQ